MLDRYDTTTSPRESWSLKTETHAVYHLSRRQADTALFGEVRLESLELLSTTPAGTKSDPVAGAPGGPILAYTFRRRGTGPFEVDSVPTSARPRGLNVSQVLELPNLVLLPPSTACRVHGAWADSAALPAVPVAGSTPSRIWWRGSFHVDSINGADAWIAGRVEIRGEGESPLPTRLRDDRTVVWLFDSQCAVPIRLMEQRRRTLVTLDPETRQPHDSASATGTGTATFAPVPSDRPEPDRRESWWDAEAQLGPNGMELRAGQEWTYRGRPADSTSTLVILEVEHGPGLQPIHVCLTGVRVPTRVAGQDTNVVHLAISDYQLPKELGRLVGEHAQPNSLCDAGRRTWLAQKPYPGVWGGSIRGYISTVASRVRPVAPPHEPRTCVLNRPRDEADTTYARRCAEAFIAQNGYTSATGVVDTSLVVPEFLDMGGVEDILEHRHGQLEPRAESAGPGLDGWGVGFRYASDPSGCTLRVVLMKSDFTGMRMVHEDAGPASDTEQGRVCAKRRAGS